MAGRRKLKLLCDHHRVIQVFHRREKMSLMIMQQLNVWASWTDFKNELKQKLGQVWFLKELGAVN